jgi:hypothetical protein
MERNTVRGSRPNLKFGLLGTACRYIAGGSGRRFQSPAGAANRWCHLKWPLSSTMQALRKWLADMSTDIDGIRTCPAK